MMLPWLTVSSPVALSLQRDGAQVLTPDPVGVGGSHQGQRTQPVHITETRAGSSLPQQNPRLLQLSLRLLPGTSASTRGAQARRLRRKSLLCCATRPHL